MHWIQVPGSWSGQQKEQAIPMITVTAVLFSMIKTTYDPERLALIEVQKNQAAGKSHVGDTGN